MNIVIVRIIILQKYASALALEGGMLRHVVSRMNGLAISVGRMR